LFISAPGGSHWSLLIYSAQAKEFYHLVTYLFIYYGRDWAYSFYRVLFGIVTFLFNATKYVI